MTSPQGVGLPFQFAYGGLQTTDAVTSEGVGVFTQSLAAANTAQALPGANASNFVAITNTSASDNIKIGAEAGQYIPLAPGQTAFFDVHERPLFLASFYWIGPNIGDTIGVTYA